MRIKMAFLSKPLSFFICTHEEALGISKIIREIPFLRAKTS